MIALIDGDLVAYRCAASANKEDDIVHTALMRCNDLIFQIMDSVQATEYRIFLSGSENFRKVINPEYKANRKDQEPPRFLQDCREYLVQEWKATLAHGQEADDELGIAQKKEPDFAFGEAHIKSPGGIDSPYQTTIICSLDKDMRMIPGLHYSWQIGTATWTKEEEMLEVSFSDAYRTFWKQMLIGDKTDNITGVHGIGPKKAEALIGPCWDVQECMEVVLEKYNDDLDWFVMNANCLWIRRHEESEWHKDLNLILSDELQQKQEVMSASMKSLREGT